ncbi:carbohydrate ABC transporter permease [Actinoalloteichus hymeniacidonis]|uniref:Carbohydrate ABC transporter membrane protein 2, CUT1 family n=1 Tax=Actinoalloteichus hymeniacidonis TaxID=340345 RepID=A0AAC9HM10_9PSEU|nr:carbohydrate ABC transporter permease [Actinoalloteichus hymeniacidonis]AOS61266.1 carbohydrate ABC transporter membrane protein 2, CUT1 family [Actinoalloteichus hymeniacidonis]MBB5910731.1 N,N'-diacetylchitobiose transport system permease protein [Actinoalloteichus hymeniacidonis]
MRPRKATRTWLSVLAIAIGVVYLFPVYWMVSSSVKPANQITSLAYDLVPLGFTLDHYLTVLTESDFLIYLRNSVIVTVTAVALAVLSGLFAALALSRFRFRGRKGFVLMVLIVQMAPFEALLIPMFLFMRDTNLLDTLPSLILVYWVITLPFTLWTLRNFVNGIPIDLEEAAMVDGCGRFQAFWKVTFPLLGPGLVACSVFAFITAWNEFLYALVLMPSGNGQTLPIFLQSFTSVFGVNWGATMATSTLFMLPVVAFFVIVQRNLVSGVTAGAVKG